MRMNMAGERDSEASGLLYGGGAYRTHPSEVSALKESDISARFDGSAAVTANKQTGKSEIEEEDGKNSFSRQLTIFKEAGIDQKSNRSILSSIVSSEGQEDSPKHQQTQITVHARLPSVFAEEVGEI
jgi:hypothetical protein